MSDTFFQLVDQDVARNQVARAIQRKTVDSSMRTFRISLYQLEDGAVEGEAIQAAAKVLAVALRVLQVRRDDSSPPARVMRGAMSALVSRAEHGFRWREADAPAVDVAMGYAVDVHGAAKAVELQAAWAYVHRLERKAAPA